AIALGPFLTKRPEVVIATSPQLLTGVVGAVLSTLRRGPFGVGGGGLWPPAVGGGGGGGGGGARGRARGGGGGGGGRPRGRRGGGWPEGVVEVGAVREGSPLVRALERVERALYRRADRIVVVTDAFVDALVERGVPRMKVDVVKNGADLELFQPRPRDEEIRTE